MPPSFADDSCIADSPSAGRCRPGCAACCIVISVSSPIPGMPDGKPAGERCVQLTDDLRCRLFGHPERPEVCLSLLPSPEMCGSSAAEAQAYLAWLEAATSPTPAPVPGDTLKREN